MNYRIITKIACKLLALNFFLISMNYLPNILITMISYRGEISNFTQSILPWFFTSACMLLTAILLWIFADKLSKAIVKNMPENFESNDMDYNKIAIIAFTVVGLFVITKAVPEMVRLMVTYNTVVDGQLNYRETQIYTDVIARIIGEAVRVGLGFWLLLGSKGIFRWVKALRNLGLDRISNIEE
ncbi:MAG: hypothetical protein K0R09_3645 [Clostridiales bacterium]|nr:hypothetical protein [Clostridiales bacterium]